MLTSTLLMLSWAVGGLNPGNVPGYDYSMPMVGTSGFNTCLIRDTNDMVLGYDVSLSYDLIYLTNDREQVPQSFSDCAFLVNSIRVNVVRYSLLSDYRETYGQTFNLNYLCDSPNEFVNHYVSCSFDEQNEYFSVGIFDLNFGSSVPRFDLSYVPTLQGHIEFGLERTLDFDESSFLVSIQDGYATRTNTAYDEGYAAGYNEGFRLGSHEDEDIAAIFNGITNIGLLPLNMFLGMFNFDILGINMTEFVMAVLSISVIVVIIKSVTGGKK